MQAAFVEYGGNRHGFLAFNEIHPDYYRIPMEDREALLAEQQAHAVDDLDDDPDESDDDNGSDDIEASDTDDDQTAGSDNDDVADDESEEDAITAAPATEVDAEGDAKEEANNRDEGDAPDPDASSSDEAETAEAADERNEASEAGEQDDQPVAAQAEAGPRRPARTERPARRPSHRRYRIQEVVTRRQIMLVQVVKEERGNKGAALTTFLSLAGRYCVLMPNTPRGGGVSRKITNAVDRKRLKQVVEGLEVPKDMAVIVRTAGSQRTKTEIKRDYEYLLRLWDQIRELTLDSSAPCLVHEEANLIKRSIRDLYTRDIDEVLVEGEEGYRTAKSFMKMLVPSHARRVQPYSNGGVPLFHNFQVESQLDGIHASTVQLRSGGYIVLNQTEALVAIDVNSGRSTRERNIEETALKTNLEAAEEVARQLRLRDLAGLIVIDYIDMDESRNQHAVERKMKDVVKNDRARIQLGRISQFGLMELSRQRLRPSVTEASTQPCPHCEGTGRVRSIDSAALQVLRNIEDEGLKQRASEVIVHVPTAIGFYILNNKREILASAEERYAFKVSLQPDDTLIAPEHRIERLGAKTASERNAVLSTIGANAAAVIDVDEGDDEVPDIEEDEDTQRERRPRRRRRRSERGRGEAEVGAETARGNEEDGDEAGAETDSGEPVNDDEEGGEDDDGAKRRRRRGKRGGRRRARRPRTEDGVDGENGDDATDQDSETGDGGETDALAASDAVSEEAPAIANTAAEDASTEEAQANAPTASETAAEPEAEAKTPRKRAPRTRRPRRRAEETAEATDQTNEASASASEQDTLEAAAPVDVDPTPEPSAPEPEAPTAATAKPETPPAEPEAEVETAGDASNGTEEIATPTPVAPDQPARKGWWNRLLS